MHAIVHLFSKKELSYREIEEIMTPFCEEEIYRFDPETEEWIPPEVYPAFDWDYYDVHIPPWFPEGGFENCFGVIDTNGTAFSRSWWNG